MLPVEGVQCARECAFKVERHTIYCRVYVCVRSNNMKIEYHPNAGTTRTCPCCGAKSRWSPMSEYYHCPNTWCDGWEGHDGYELAEEY